MTNGEQSVFTFDLNESLWFKKGQEVDEIMGISLEPEISIQEFNDYVSIRGVIELTGEYFQVKSTGSEESEEEDLLKFRDHPTQRFVDRVENYADGVNEFFHKFPVEVSIPKYRIESLDDVMVGIESFDYQLPEGGQLNLNASVAIHGVRADRAEQESEEEQRVDDSIEEEPIPEPPAPPVDETFEFDVKEKEEPEVQETEAEDLTLETERAVNAEIEVEPVEEESSESSESSASKPEKDRWKGKKSQTIAEFFGHDEKVEKEEIVESSEEVSYESDFVSLNAYDGESDDDWESSRAEGRNPDSTYLLNIFDDQEEESYARMKICIVQESDTLESIADKYDVSPINISQTNRLTDDDLTEGQILYIPSKVTKME